MRPEDIRKLYRDESPADDAEARETEQRARTDPDEARRLLLTLYALAGDDRDFNNVLSLVLRAATMQLVALQADKDDQFALAVAGMILDAMEQLGKASRVQRGRPKTARSA